MRARTSRKLSAYLKRASRMSSASDSEAKKNSRTRGAGPRLKNGGGVCSIPTIERGPLYPPSASVVGEDRTEVLHLLESLARAAHHAGQRVVGDDHREPGLLHQQPVEVAQERAAAGEHHALLGDVRAELGRRLLQGRLHRGDDLVEWLGERLENLVRRDGEAARNALGEVA